LPLVKKGEKVRFRSTRKWFLRLSSLNRCGTQFLVVFGLGVAVLLIHSPEQVKKLLEKEQPELQEPLVGPREGEGAEPVMQRQEA
jgi:hypothetical protein